MIWSGPGSPEVFGGIDRYILVQSLVPILFPVKAKQNNRDGIVV